jgi:NADH-quinone oxidoreductase subunit G
MSMKVTIDGIPVDVEPGTSILNAARQIGGDIVPPAMCYYSKLKDSGGKCRTCLVKVSKGSEKDPRPMPKLVASCRTPVADGMEVQNITSPEVIEARKGIVESTAAQQHAMNLTVVLLRKLISAIKYNCT